MTIDDENELSNFSIIKKIKKYCKDSTLTIVFSTVFKLTLSRSNTLEASYFVEFVRKFYGDFVPIDSFLLILENEHVHKIDISEEYPDIIILEYVIFI